VNGPVLGISPRRALPIAVSVALALAAQYLFTGELLTRTLDTNTWEWFPRYSWASVLLVAAVGVAALAFRPGRDDVVAPGVPTRPVALESRLALSVAFLGVLSYLGSIAVFLRSGETSLVRELWLLGIVLFLAPFLARDRAMFRVAGHPAWEWGLVALLTLAGFWLRHHEVEDLPAQVHADVALMGNATIEAMEASPERWLGLAPSKHPYSTHQVLALGMRLFGRDHYGLVMHSVLAGTATIPILYLLGRTLFGRAVGLLAAGLLAVSYTHIHFSRTLFGPLATLSVTLALTFLASALRSGTPAVFALSGAALSFGLFNYYSARVGPVIVATLALWQLAVDRAAFRRAWRGWALLVASALVVFGPKLALFVTDFESFAGRGTSVAIWNPDVLAHTMAKYHASGLLEVLFYQARDSFLTFHLFGDGSPHFTFRRPMVSAPAAVFLAVGVGFALRRSKVLPVAIPLVWLTLTLVLGGVITADAPYWPHLNIALPAVSLLSALGATAALFGLLPATPRARLLGTGLLAAGLVSLGLQNWATYVSFAEDNAGPRARGARYVDSLPPGSRAYLLSPDLHWSEHQFLFFGRDVAGRNTTQEEVLAGTLDMTPPAAILLYGRSELLPEIEARYPGGSSRALGRPGGPPVLHVYEKLVRGAAPQPDPPPWSRPGWTIVGALVGLTALRAGISIYRDAACAPTRPGAGAPPASAPG
jgi:4-amino-4-deoxy-L-arabinose transferase-like glycosyltransferase